MAVVLTVVHIVKEEVHIVKEEARMVALTIVVEVLCLFILIRAQRVFKKASCYLYTYLCMHRQQGWQ